MDIYGCFIEETYTLIEASFQVEFPQSPILFLPGSEVCPYEWQGFHQPTDYPKYSDRNRQLLQSSITAEISQMAYFRYRQPRLSTFGCFVVRDSGKSLDNKFTNHHTG